VTLAATFAATLAAVVRASALGLPVAFAACCLEFAACSPAAVVAVAASVAAAVTPVAATAAMPAATRVQVLLLDADATKPRKLTFPRGKPFWSE
jgi:Mrp family chromosome partitioning ATPase